MEMDGLDGLRPCKRGVQRRGGSVRRGCGGGGRAAVALSTCRVFFLCLIDTWRHLVIAVESCWVIIQRINSKIRSSSSSS